MSTKPTNEVMRRIWEAETAEARRQSSIIVQEREKFQTKIAELKAEKDNAYEERNRCVALIAHFALFYCCGGGTKQTNIDGWDTEWHGCVYIDLPTGQVSWHYHDTQADIFSFLPAYDGEWDGHDTAEKYRRISKMTESAA